MATNTRSEWLQHALRQAPWRAQVQATALVALVLVVAIIIGALYLAQATSTATAGRDLEELNAQIKQLERDIEQLRAQIAAAQTVPNMTRRAQELGFVPAGNEQLLYLVVEGYRPPEPAPVVPVEPPVVPAYDETLNDWLNVQWAGLLDLLGVGGADAQEAQP
ncbi:MAG: hypothetical protein M5R40_13350 [Anaerolineae bacterium]|nr:hypothetical protein [Anaerolineae bacterium]